MAEVWVAAVATVAVGAYSANQQKKSAQGAANAAAQGTAAEIAERQRQFDLTRQDQAPWLQAGTSALGRLSALSSGDMSGFYTSPDYRFNVEQQMQGLDRSAAARGAMFSGGADADRMKMMSGLASQQFGDYWNRQAGLANVGQTVASGLGSLGMGMANQNAYSIGNATLARQSAYGARADANAQLAATTANAFGNWYGANSARNGGGTGWYLGNNPGKG